MPESPKADLHRYLQAARDALLWKLDGLSGRSAPVAEAIGPHIQDLMAAARRWSPVVDATLAAGWRPTRG
jgi:hypothetical protein